MSLTSPYFSLILSYILLKRNLMLYFCLLQVKVPYLSILSNLALFVVPCFIGVLIRKLRPAIGDKLGRMIKPFSLIFIIYLLSFGLYVNRYIYNFMGRYPSIIPPSIIQPYLGFGFGFCIARFAARQPKYRSITIAIETGVQNVTIPMVMLQGSFPQPFGDIAAVMPVMTAHFTPLPLLFVFIGLTVYRRFFAEKCGKGEEDGDNEEEKDPAKAKEIEAKQGSQNYQSKKPNPNVDYRDSLLVQNGLTGSQLGKQFFSADKESVI